MPLHDLMTHQADSKRGGLKDLFQTLFAFCKFFLDPYFFRDVFVEAVGPDHFSIHDGGYGMEFHIDGRSVFSEPSAFSFDGAAAKGLL